MYEKLASIEEKYNQLTDQLGDPSIIADPAKYHKHAKARRDLEAIVEKFNEYKRIQKGIVDAKMLIEDAKNDSEMRVLAEDELNHLQQQLIQCEQALKVLLMPKDPHDEKNVLLEIRAGTGGDEASLFAAELFRMYSKYAERQGWRI